MGRDLRAVERIYWDSLPAHAPEPRLGDREGPGGVENALLDAKAKALGVPVHELFGGPTRDTIPLYWSHCGTTRARAYEVTGTPKLASYDDVAALGRRWWSAATCAFKTNIAVPGEEPAVVMPGFGPGGGAQQAGEISDALVRLLEAFAEGTGGAARPIVDLNFNLEPEGILGVAKRLEPFDLLWLEVDLFDPAAGAGQARADAVCSGENLCGSRATRPFWKRPRSTSRRWT